MTSPHPPPIVPDRKYNSGLAHSMKVYLDGDFDVSLSLRLADI